MRHELSLGFPQGNERQGDDELGGLVFGCCAWSPETSTDAGLSLGSLFLFTPAREGQDTSKKQFKVQLGEPMSLTGII